MKPMSEVKSVEIYLELIKSVSWFISFLIYKMEMINIYTSLGCG